MTAYEIYLFLLVVGDWASFPGGLLYSFKIISYGLKAAAVRAGIRIPAASETCYGFVGPFCFWNTVKKSTMLPILIFLIVFGVSMKMACGQNFATFCLAVQLYRKGLKMSKCLLVFLLIQASTFIWYSFEMGDVVGSLIPEDFDSLYKIFVTYFWFTAVNVFCVLVILTCILYWVTILDSTKYYTSLISSCGAGFSLSILSDFTTLLGNALAVGLNGLDHILLCVIPSVWSLCTLLSFIAVSERRPYPFTIPLAQPVAFGLLGLIFALILWGSLDDVAWHDLRSAVCLIITSSICICIDASDPNVPQESGAPPQFMFIDALWDDLLHLREKIWSQRLQAPDCELEIPEINVIQIQTTSVDLVFSSKGRLLESESELGLSSGDGDEDSEEIEVIFHQ